MTATINTSQRRNSQQKTHKVLDAKFVSSCFNCPSNARPHLSLLFASSGVSVKTLDNVKPGPIGQPSLKHTKQDTTSYTTVIYINFTYHSVHSVKLSFTYLPPQPICHHQTT